MATRKAEMWDKMQYLFRNYYDRMVHIACRVKGKIDFEALLKAVDILVFKVDILRCSYVPNPVHPHWRIHTEYDVTDVVKHIFSDDIEKDTDKALCNVIATDSPFQFRITVIEGSNGETSITILLNHMCADGGDTKYLMSKLTELYADIVQGGDGTKVAIKQGRRDSMQLYDRMTPEKAKRAKKLYKNISQSKINVKFPFTVEDGKNEIRLLKMKLDETFVTRLNSARKKCNATMNDVLLAGFFRKLYDYLNGKESKLNIVSMMDLRRYCGGETLGVTNMTGFAPCEIDMNDETFLDTLAKVKTVMAQNKKDEFMGLYSLPLLKLAYSVFPYFISNIAIRIGYKNPLTGMSNIGILEEAKYAFYGTELIDCLMTGAAKYKPYMQLTTTTFKNTMTFCIIERCNERDEVILRQFLADFKQELEVFIQQSNTISLESNK